MPLSCRCTLPIIFGIASVISSLSLGYSEQINLSSEIVDVSQPGISAREMAVTLDRSGHVTMIWANQGSDNSRPLQARYESNGWQEWVNIESTGSNWNPQLAQAGEVSTAVWLSHVDGDYRVFGARSIGGAWTQPQILGISPVWPDPTVVMDGQGCAIAAWTVEIGLRSRHFCGGEWGPETTLTTESNSKWSRLAANAMGSVIAVWEQIEEAGYAIGMARYESGRWSAPVILHQSDTIVARPQAVLDDRGNAIVAWEAAGSNETRLIQAREFKDGAWLATVDLSSSHPAAAKIQLSKDEAGHVMAVWSVRDGDDLLIQGAYLSQGNWSPAMTLGVAGRADNWGERGLPAPRVASMGEGQFAVIWSSWNNAEKTGSVITASLETGRWVPAEPLTTTQGYPLVDVAAQPGGQIIYVWNNAGVIQSLSRGINTPLLSVKRSGEGLVTSAPAGIDCGEDCTASYARGTSVFLTAHAGPGQVFGGWAGNCMTRSDAICWVLMSDARHVGAVFRPVNARTRPLDLRMNGLGTGRVASDPVGLDCTSESGGADACLQANALFEVGKRIQMVATPAENSYFAGWQGGCSGKGVTCAFKLLPGMSPVRVVAIFKLNPVIRVELAEPGLGRVISGDGFIDCGSTCSATKGYKQLIDLQAEPAKGSRFLGWSGACSGKKTTCRVRMNANRLVKARFGP